MAVGAKEKILKSAKELILINGYHGTGTNAIIEHSGTSKGSFFYHFPDKSKLIAETLKDFFCHNLHKPLIFIMENSASAKDGLISFIEALEKYLASTNFYGGCLIGNMTQELADSDPEIRALVKQLFIEYRQALDNYISQNELNIDKEEFIFLYIGAIEGITMTVRAHKDPEQASKEFNACKTLVNMAFK